ncbi:hypothetical protein N9P58_00795 [Puniceicoccaceae bacterium]|nr:hypothetical protein [Puniceicoccaceae bacterium]
MMKINQHILFGLYWLLGTGLSFGVSELTFDDSGRPVSVILGEVELLKSKSSGFTLHYSDGENSKEMLLSEIATSGNTIKASSSNGYVHATFQLDSYDNHLAIHLLEVQGIGSGRGYRLSLDFDSKDIAAYALNDMATSNTGNRRRKHTELSWPYLWSGARPNGTRGSVVLYDNSLSGAALDAVLAEIWSVQGSAGHMVRPAGQKTWAAADVMAWVERWVKKFETMVSVSIAPENQEELYEMTDTYVIPHGANRVYMFSTIWRGEYTLRKLANESVAGDPFPGGKKDLLEYSNYLAKHGAHLQLKSLVPQMGHEDARYFSDTHCETRLLSWGSGTLVEAIDTKATTLRFKLGADYVWEKDSGYIRIGNELIRANKITSKGADGVWTFSECERGMFATTAKQHSVGAEVIGVSHSYGYVHFADDFGQPDSLAEEVLGAYGDFLNEVNAGHLHFDGTGHHDEAPWYLRNYTDYVYSRVDQPVTGSRVGGSIKANFERMFSIAKQAKKATSYWGIRIGPRLHGQGRGSEKAQRNFSPNMMDIHFDVSDRILLGGRRPNLTAGRSGGTLTTNIVENYGLMDEALDLFNDWIELAPVFDDADVDYIRGKLKKKRGSNHYTGEDVLVLSKNIQGGYIYTPHRVMGRTSGEDPLIHIDQEWGAIPRYQDITPGTSLELLNPYDAQSPQVVIYVKEKSKTFKNPQIIMNGGELTVKGKVQPNEYMKFEGGDTASVYDENWNLLRTLPAMTKSFIANKGSNTITTNAGSASGNSGLRVQFITRGPVYVLETNKHLAGLTDASDRSSDQVEAMNLNESKLPVTQGLFLDLDANVNVDVEIEERNRVKAWHNQVKGNDADVFVKQDAGREHVGSGRPTLKTNVAQIGGNNTLVFEEQELIHMDEDAFDHMVTGSGYTWFSVMSVYEQNPGKKDVNSFFGNLRNSNPYEGFWGNVMDDNIVWIGTRNGFPSKRKGKKNSNDRGTPGLWDDRLNPCVQTQQPLEENRYYLVMGRMGAGTEVADLELFVNSATAVDRKPVPVNPNANPSKMVIGQERDAINHPGKESFHGEIARFLVYERPLSDAELSEVIGYLTGLYGIQ